MGSWERHYTYGTNKATNQLLETKLSGHTNINYTCYGSINIKELPDLQWLEWNHQDKLIRVELDSSGNVAHYSYDGGGQRTRKIITKNGLKQKERLYLGLVERYQEYDNNGVVTLERWTLQVEGLAQVDTLTVRHAVGLSSPTPVARYQYRDRLGSSTIEANEHGEVISYEEYYPYGSSAYRAAASGVDLSLKRYRFTGKERDEETGLDYFGVRYYASWLGRWTSGDPGGFVDGLNLYRYTQNNPVNGIDAAGYSTEDVEEQNYQSPEEPPEIDPPKDGKLVRYKVGEGQGFTHVAAHLNKASTQEEFGYTLEEPIDWKDIAFQWDNFKKYSLVEFTHKHISFEDAGDPFPEAWRSMNMNEGDPLIIVTNQPEEIISSDEQIEQLQEPFINPLAGTSYSATIGGGSVGAGLPQGVGVGGDIFRFKVPDDFPGWEAGESMTIIGGAVFEGTSGVSGSGGAGRITLNYDGVNSSVFSILQEPSDSYAGGFAFIIGPKVLYTESREGGYSFWQVHIMMGGKIDASGVLESTSIIRVPPIDSMQKAIDLRRRHGVGVMPQIDTWFERNQQP